MSTTDLEDRLSELLDKAEASGLSWNEIVSVLELALMSAKERNEAE